MLYFIDNLQNSKSGIFTSLLQTVEVLIKFKKDFTVAGGVNKNISVDNWNGHSQGFNIIGFKSLNYLFGFNEWLQNNIQKYDLVSIHTYWSYSNKFIVASCIKYNIPYLITIHGVFNKEALKISNWKKKFANHFFLNLALKNAKCIQALNTTEYEVIRSLGIKNPIAIIENGISIPDHSNPKKVSSEFEAHFNGRKNALYLGRIHPIKGIERLLHSWINVVNNESDWQLIIAGDGDNKYIKTLEKIIQLNNCRTIKFIGHVEGNEKDYCFRNCVFTVLPSLSEAFPMSILESLSYSKPALLTSTCNFKESAIANAAIEVESSTQGLQNGLEVFLNKSTFELEIMGKNGLALIEEKYVWTKIHQKLDQLYSWMVDEKSFKPSFIKLD